MGARGQAWENLRAPPQPLLQCPSPDAGSQGGWGAPFLGTQPRRPGWRWVQASDRGQPYAIHSPWLQLAPSCQRCASQGSCHQGFRPGWAVFPAGGQLAASSAFRHWPSLGAQAWGARILRRTVLGCLDQEAAGPSPIQPQAVARGPPAHLGPRGDADPFPRWLRQRPPAREHRAST